MHDRHFGFITIFVQINKKTKSAYLAEKLPNFVHLFALNFHPTRFLFLFLNYDLKRNLTWQSPCSMPNGRSHVQGLKFESGHGFHASVSDSQ
jgi:hypothetical protein